jgi:hypothetical protein
MGRTKGTPNKNTAVRPPVCKLSEDERVQLVANLIVDRILADQQNGQPLLKKAKRSNPSCQTA